MKALIETLGTLTDATRLRMIRLLLRRELCVCELMDALRMPQYKVSRHLRKLRTAGLVEARRDGRWMHYRIARISASKGFHRDLLTLVGGYLDEQPEGVRDDARLARRLALRRAGRCVVGRTAC